jgi:hypothetical protein
VQRFLSESKMSNGQNVEFQIVDIRLYTYKAHQMP